MDSIDSKVQILYEMCKYQNEYAEIYRKEQIKKRKEYNILQFSKKYYGNSKEYRRDWIRNGAMINK